MKTLAEHVHLPVYIRTDNHTLYSGIKYWVPVGGGEVRYVNDSLHVQVSGHSPQRLQEKEDSGRMLQVLPPHEVL